MNAKTLSEIGFEDSQRKSKKEVIYISEFIERLHPFIRWLLVIPTFLLVYFILNLFANISITRMIGPPEAGFVNTIVYMMSYDLINVALAVYACCFVVPKGKIVVASIFAGISVFLLGANVIFLMMGRASIHVVFSSIATVVACLIVVFGLVKEKNKSKSEITA